jgi:hypothetical protein
MTLDDIKFIFEDQIESGTDKVWFMLCDNNYRLIERHDSNRLNELIPMLDSFTYSGNIGNIPRFSK